VILLKRIRNLPLGCTIKIDVAVGDIEVIVSLGVLVWARAVDVENVVVAIDAELGTNSEPHGSFRLDQSK